MLLCPHLFCLLSCWPFFFLRNFRGNVYAQLFVSFQKQNNSPKASPVPSSFLVFTNLARQAIPKHTDSPGTTVPASISFSNDKSVNTHINPIIFPLKHLKVPQLIYQTKILYAFHISTVRNKNLCHNSFNS